jgi:AraC-like DNA-binding protein
MLEAPVRSAATPVDLPEVMQISSNDLDHARSLLNRFYYPISVSAPHGVDGFALNLEVIQLGPLTIGELGFGGATRLIASDLDSYHVTLPTSGRVLTRHRGGEVVASPRTAAVFRPGNPVYTLHDAQCVELDVKVNGTALENELSALLGRPVDGPIDLAPTMDVASGTGRSFRSLIALLRDELAHPESLVHHPLIAERVSHSIMNGLLFSLPHRYFDELTAPARPDTPRAVRRAVNAMEDEPERSYSVADLAGIAGTSVRSLQEGFRRHLGCTPMAYLQQVRLNRVHRALREGDPAVITVAATAHRWGFAHLGRFASAYRIRFGEAPSETLRH